MMKKSIFVAYNIMFTSSEYLIMIIAISSNISGVDVCAPAEVELLVFQIVFVLILKRDLYVLKDINV